MNDFYSNLISTIVGVVVGGLITIKINDISNTKLLKKEHGLLMLQEIKYLLNNWQVHILEDTTDPFIENDLKKLKLSSLSKDLQKLIAYFNANMSVLKPFKTEFWELRNKEIALKFKADKYKSKLLELAEEHSLTETIDTSIYPEGFKIWEEYGDEAHDIIEGIQKLIVLIDEYISNDILK